MGFQMRMKRSNLTTKWTPTARPPLTSHCPSRGPRTSPSQRPARLLTRRTRPRRLDPPLRPVKTPIKVPCLHSHYRRCRPSSPRRSEVLLLARSAPSSMTTPSFSGPSGPPLRMLASPAESHLLPYNRRRQSEALLPPSSERARQSLWRLHRLQLHLLRLQRGRQRTLPAKSDVACDRAPICVSTKVSSTSAPTGATS